MIFHIMNSKRYMKGIMVEFLKLYEDESLVVYEYYPEGRKTDVPGVIQVDKKEPLIHIVQCAEGDYFHDLEPERLEIVKNELNQKRKEDGLPYLSSSQWCDWKAALRIYYYGNHVIHMISNYYELHHKFIDKGKISGY